MAFCAAPLRSAHALLPCTPLESPLPSPPLNVLVRALERGTEAPPTCSRSRLVCSSSSLMTCRFCRPWLNDGMSRARALVGVRLPVGLLGAGDPGELGVGEADVFRSPDRNEKPPLAGVVPAAAGVPMGEAMWVALPAVAGGGGPGPTIVLSRTIIQVLLFSAWRSLLPCAPGGR